MSDQEQVAKMRGALLAIQAWDVLNPPRGDLLADLPWLRSVVDHALADPEPFKPSQGQLNYMLVLGALRDNPEPLIQWAAQTIVSLGAKAEWSMDENFATTEGIAGLASAEYGLPFAADQHVDELRFYGLAEAWLWTTQP